MSTMSVRNAGVRASKEGEGMAEMVPQIRVITMKRACEILAEHGLKTDPNKLGLGLQQRVYPFGVAIQAGRWIYEVYEHQLLKWIEERAG